VTFGWYLSQKYLYLAHVLTRVDTAPLRAAPWPIPCDIKAS